MHFLEIFQTSIIRIRPVLAFLFLFFVYTPGFGQSEHILVKCGFPDLVPPASEPSAKSGKLGGSQTITGAADRPEASHHYLTRDSLFLIHYNIGGTNGINPSSTIVDGVPDWVIETERALQKAYHMLVDSLGFDPPPMDKITYPQDPPGGAYDIYYRDWTIYGMTYYEELADIPGRPNAYSGYMVFENDFSEPERFYTLGTDALHVTAAHEFFHLIQLGYTLEFDGISPSHLWLYELSSSWFEEVAYPEVNDYVNYVRYYFTDPMPLHDAGFDGLEGYRTAHYGFILSDYQRPRLWERIWRKFVDMDPYPALDHALRDVAGVTFAESYRKFAGWNLLTGNRVRPGIGYPDANALPEIETRRAITVADSLPLTVTVPSRDILYSDVNFEAGSADYYSLLFTGNSGQMGGNYSLNSTPGVFTPIMLGKGVGMSPAGSNDLGVMALVNPNDTEGEVRVSLNETTVRVYPNPITPRKNDGRMHIYLVNERPTTFRLHIYDLLGREVYSTNFGNREYAPGPTTLTLQIQETPLESSSSGQYFLRIRGKKFRRNAKILLIK